MCRARSWIYQSPAPQAPTQPENRGDNTAPGSDIPGMLLARSGIKPITYLVRQSQSAVPACRKPGSIWERMDGAHPAWKRSLRELHPSLLPTPMLNQGWGEPARLLTAPGPSSLPERGWMQRDGYPHLGEFWVPSPIPPHYPGARGWCWALRLRKDGKR